MSKNRKIFNSIIFFAIFLFIPFFYLNSFSKYLIENSFTIANLNIDICKPNIELINVANTNKGYEKYASRKHIITVQIKITKNNISVNNFNENNIKIEVGNQSYKPDFKKFELIFESDNFNIYNLVIYNITGNR